ncbi:cupin domain-containing protein [Streptomyces sp. NBC_00249]|uniref:cupin domain-containing protein n=1 Tax=Streptomyces sp. NBC_00249 TaxID=2975690 RepID=UPI0022502DD5|nr:cupin domain-containing protein [Streptomyces sp. NBC_00249]MCX5196627.1 cupin domain-containing protein [Streptomyces sp. NBC_00249]
MGVRQATVRRPRATAPSDLMGREVVIEPGGCTGWHYHRVPLVAVVMAGTLTRILSDGAVEVHVAGDTFVEPAGTGHIHLGRNFGDDPVVLLVTCDLAPGAPFALPAAVPFGAKPCGCPGHGA